MDVLLTTFIYTFTHGFIRVNIINTFRFQLALQVFQLCITTWASTNALAFVMALCWMILQSVLFGQLSANYC